MTLNGMESLLSHTYFETENKTEMYSDVITAILPSVNNTNLTEPVNFTIRHKKVLLNSSALLFFFLRQHTTCCLSIYLKISVSLVSSDIT